MIGSKHSYRNAIIGFLLVAVLILGGMGWTTVVTMRLARAEMAELDREKEYQHLEQRYLQLHHAIWTMEEVVVPILAFEYGRPYADYAAVRLNSKPIWSPSGELYEPGSLVLESPLVAGPSIDWIELYFQVDPDGVWTSPQIPDSLPPGIDHPLGADDLSVQVARSSLARVQSSLPTAELATKHARACRCALAVRDEAGVVVCPLKGSRLADAAKAVGASKVVGRKGPCGRALRNQGRLPRQLQSLAQDACDPQSVVANSIRNSIWPDDSRDDHSPGRVAVEVAQPQPIWLDAQGGSDLRLAFVRKVNAGDEIFYQGFTILWHQLERRLLDEISDLFPEANLEPVTDPSSFTSSACAEMLITLPVRLNVPELPETVPGDALASVRGTILAGWVSSLFILVLVGLGFRNLVLLTDRRLQFAYAVTHELRTPLTTFQLYSDMLAAGLVPEESKQEYLDTLNSESQRLSGLVESVLEYARLENQKVRTKPVDTDGPGLRQALIDSYSERCVRHGVDLFVEDSVGDDETICTDVRLLSQITGVLVNNACRHARTSDSPMVRIDFGMTDGYLTVDVADSGRGINRADARHVFKPFRRGVDASSGAPGGVGLGLALARGWAKVMGGKLELHSRSHPVYGGACFRLSVPNQQNGQGGLNGS